MRRYLFFALLLCLQWTAWGQATYDYRYWFDTDDGNQRTGSFAADSWHIDADLSGLDCSLHAIHIQVKDTAGVWSAPVTRHFIKMTAGSATGAYYWFNDDFARRQPLASVSGRFDIDVSALPESMHYFHYQANDGAGTVSAPQTAFFLKMPDMKTMKYRYWMDNDQSTMQGGYFTGGPMMIDVSEVADGFHIIYFQMEGVSGASVPANRMFIKIPQTENIGEMTCVCTIDGKLYKQEKVPSSGGLVDWTLDVSTLFQGLHRIQVQVLTPSGAASNVYDSFFFRTTMQDELKDMTLVYSVDGEAYQSQSGDFNTGMFHFDVDVASLEDGLHRLTYMLTSETGTTTKVSTAFFVKTPLGGPGIASYKYWLNDYEDEARFVKLAERKNPYELISLLPVDECPIRSTCFQFEVEEDGTPMVYAKNDIHLQFFDVSNRVAEAHKQYVDYNVGETIEEISLLESGKRIYKAKPQDNKIYWFKTEAVVGDSLSIKTDQACTLQIFSPSGKEMYSGSGSETVSFDGCHADEDGTYYIALHDVTGTKGNTIALDFQHIDKYDVLRWDVSTVGNGGASTITYEGNGFKDLYAIDYVSTNGDTIKCEYIDHISDATISATMDFNGATLGTYKAIFHFTEGDKVMENIVKVEEATEMKLGITVNYPSTFLRGTSCTYDIAVTNYGNMMAYLVPIELRLKVDNVDDILNIEFRGDVQNVSTLCQGIVLDSLDTDTKKLLDELCRTASDLSQFITFRDTISHKDYAISQVFINIPPNSTKKFFVEFTSNATVNLEAYIANSWLPLTNYSMTRSGARGIFNRDWMCCQKERIQCVADVVTQFTGMLPPHIGCATSMLKTGLSASFDVWCSDGNDISERWNNYINNNGKSLAQDLIGSLVDCITSYYRILKKKLRNDYTIANRIGNKTEADRIYAEILAARKMEESLLRDIFDGITTFLLGDKCYTAFTQRKPDCPPDPPGGGGSSNPVNSYDPNDIYGYRSESGSKAVKKDWTDVYYTIEFENDTAFATASAQDVYLTDTLDSRYFDLKSFAPTSLKIGDKKVELSGEPNFVTTVDMRPKINAIAQVECQYDEQRGIAKWHFTSLDPMTMEHVTVPMDGFLPVNNSEGDGQGEVSFNIRLKTGLADGEQIPNRASIVFDLNEAIMTPTWINVVDTIAPQSAVVETAMKNDTIMTISFDGTDNYSGVWKYDLYVQAGVGASWFKLAENLTDSLYDYRVYDGIDYGFCVIATDSAGNVEQKELVREWPPLDYLPGDANGDGRISVVDLTMVTNAILRKEDEGFNAKAADLNMDGQISITDATMITNLILKK